jgi:hypothetical protein
MVAGFGEGSRMMGYPRAAIEAVVCSGLGSRIAVTSGARVEDRGVLKDGRCWWPMGVWKFC